MTVVLGLDTATPATAVAVIAPEAEAVELRHDPAPGERPQHASRLLPLAREALAAAGLAAVAGAVFKALVSVVQVLSGTVEGAARVAGRAFYGGAEISLALLAVGVIIAAPSVTKPM